MSLDYCNPNSDTIEPTFLRCAKFMKKLRENSTLKKIGLQRGKGWGYKDANALNDKAV